jgi:hypothetical protein
MVLIDGSLQECRGKDRMNVHATTSELSSKSSMTAQPIVKLAAIQFVLYSAALSAAALGWLLAISDNHGLLATILGQYLADHVIRWTAEVPLWGFMSGVAGLLGFFAAWALWRTRPMGVGFGVASYIAGFAIDLAVARTLFVHSAAGLLVGWMLLSPLVFGWKCFVSGED